MEAYQKSFKEVQNELGVFNQGLNKNKFININSYLVKMK